MFISPAWIYSLEFQITYLGAPLGHLMGIWNQFQLHVSKLQLKCSKCSWQKLCGLFSPFLWLYIQNVSKPYWSICYICAESEHFSYLSCHHRVPAHCPFSPGAAVASRLVSSRLLFRRAVFNLAARSILLEHKSCYSSAQNPLITPHHFQAEARVAGIPCATLCGPLGLCLDLPLHVRWLPSLPRTRRVCFSELLHGCPLCLEHSNCRYSVHSGLC